MSVSADELLSKGHVCGNAGQFLQRVASHARVRALDALEQIVCTPALRSPASVKHTKTNTYAQTHPTQQFSPFVIVRIWSLFFET